jgi:hypothetical protein
VTLDTSHIISAVHPNLMGADSLGSDLWQVRLLTPGAMLPHARSLVTGLLPAVQLGRPDHDVCRTERKAVSGWSPNVLLCGRNHANATAEWKGETSPSGFSSSID